MTHYTNKDVRTLAGLLRGWEDGVQETFTRTAARLLESSRVTVTAPPRVKYEPGTLAWVLTSNSSDYEIAFRNQHDAWGVLYRDGSAVMMTDDRVDDVRPVAVVDADDVDVITYEVAREISQKIIRATGPVTYPALGVIRAFFEERGVTSREPTAPTERETNDD